MFIDAFWFCCVNGTNACLSVVVKKCGMVYTVMEEERYRNITDSVGGLMYPFPLSLEQS